MKKYILLFLLSFFSLNAFSQEKDIESIKIRIDISNSKLKIDNEKLNSLKPGDFYQIEITGVNTSLYKFSIGNKDTSKSEPLSFPTFASLPIDGLTAAVAGLSSLGGLAGSRSIIDNDGVKLAGGSLSDMNLTDGKTKMLIDKMASAAPKDPGAQVEPILLSAKEHIKIFLSQLEGEKRKLDNILVNTYKTILANQVKENNASLFGTIQNPKDLLEDIFKIRKKLDELSEEINNEYKNYRTLVNANNFPLAIRSDENLKALDAQIRKAYDEFEPAIQKIKDTISGDNFFKLLNLLLPSINKEDKYTSLPIQLTEDETVLEIKATPRSEALGLSEYYSKIKFPMNNKSFWGLSSGFYVSFPADDSYSVRTNFSSTDTTFSLVNENPEKLEIGFNTLLRRGWKIGCNQNTYWHVGFGPGLTVTNKVKPRFLLGTGLAFGDKHAFLVDVGLITGYYDVLSNAVDANKLENIPISPTDYMKSKLKAGGYFSISYLFLK